MVCQARRGRSPCRAWLLWEGFGRDAPGRQPRRSCGPRQVAAKAPPTGFVRSRSEEHTSELQSREKLVCRLLLEKKKGVEAAHPGGWFPGHGRFEHQL